MIKVSVIIPVWNVEKYLRECLESVVNQTLKEIEVIIVNDESPDNSEEIILEYKNKYPKLIKYIKKKNGGVGSARNKGLDIAKGEFISFVDSDDWIDKNMLEEMYNLAKKENNDIVICDMLGHFTSKNHYHDCTHFNSPYEKTPSACNKIFRRKLINNLRFFEEKIWYEDLDFTSKLYMLGAKISTISKGFYHCHAHDNSIMTNNNSIKNLDMLICIEDIKKFAKENNLYNEETISYIIFHHVLITTIMRVANQKSKDKKKVIKKMISYCKENIGNYKKYDYYKNIPRNRKIIANLNYRGLYKISLLLIKLKSKVKGNTKNEE